MLSIRVAVIIINPNILRGKVDNPHFNFINQELFSLGLTVEKICVLSYSESAIVNEVTQLLKLYDYVFLIVNLQSCNMSIVSNVVAKVFNEELLPNPGLKLFTEQNNICIDALLPRTAKIFHFQDANCSFSKVQPMIYLQRLFILPADVKILNNDGKSLIPYITLMTDIKKFDRAICLNLYDELCSIIEEVRNKYSIDVSTKKSKVGVVINLRGINLRNVLDAENFIKYSIKSDILYCEERDTSNSIQYQQCRNIPHIKQAINHIEECFDTYGPDSVFLSFNGGKDCTVLLHLALIVLRQKYPQYKKPMYCLYVQYPNPLQEVDDFISLVEQYYNLRVVTFSTSVKNALKSVLEGEKSMKACLMGTRRTDPYSSDMKIFQMTDKDWPQVMRVSPLLDWHYSDIWDYLLFFKVPYSTLYDMGYTSLGSKNNTVPNPELLYNDGVVKTEKYLPAYKLLDASKERIGRS